jgi:AcrR family transcriptional regulator
MTVRRYEKRQRAVAEAETRRRIVDATISLHAAVGGPATTVTAIAARAGVSRLTVYRHFPDEHALLAACTGTYLAGHPPPDFTAWGAIDHPVERLRRALAELYPFYRRNQDLLARADQEMPSNPVLRDVMSDYVQAIEAMREALLPGWDAADPSLLRGALGHALHFGTWHSLAIDQGLSDEQAVALIEPMVVAAARRDPSG